MNKDKKSQPKNERPRIKIVRSSVPVKTGVRAGDIYLQNPRGSGGSP